MVSTPKAPDPKETAAAQGAMNRDTAITQQQLNMIDQIGPTGSLTYKQSGWNEYKDADGKLVKTPKYTQTTSLSPEQQKIFDQTQAASLNLGTIANERSNFLKDYLSKPFDVNAATEQKLYDMGAARLDPRFAQQEEQMRSRLTAQGIRPGTEAYSRAMSDFNQSKNDAYNSLALSGRSQAFNEAAYERAAPLNEISALMSGSQVSTPQFGGSTPQAGVAGVDYAGLVNDKYKADSQRSGAALGGLFGLATSGIGLLSDRRAKTDIKRVGMLDNGLPVYSYRYIGDITPQIGLMADEVEKVHPHAVVEGEDGFKRVRYDIATEAYA